MNLFFSLWAFGHGSENVKYIVLISLPKIKSISWASAQIRAKFGIFLLFNFYNIPDAHCLLFLVNQSSDFQICNNNIYGFINSGNTAVD